MFFHLGRFFFKNFFQYYFIVFRYMYLISFVIYIVICVCSCDAIVSGIVFLILFLNCSLLMGRTQVIFYFWSCFLQVCSTCFILIYCGFFMIVYIQDHMNMIFKTRIVLQLLSKSESSLFVLLFCLSWIKLSMLNITCESRYLCTFPYFRGIAFSFSLLNMMLLMGFL